MVRPDPVREARDLTARVTRNALRALANEPGIGAYFTLIAQAASDETLITLQRMLK